MHQPALVARQLLLPVSQLLALFDLAQQFFDVPIVLVSLVDANRQWFKSRLGLSAPETARAARGDGMHGSHGDESALASGMDSITRRTRSPAIVRPLGGVVSSRRRSCCCPW